MRGQYTNGIYIVIGGFFALVFGSMLMDRIFESVTINWASDRVKRARQQLFEGQYLTRLINEIGTDRVRTCPNSGGIIVGQ
jgi:hypothetical protein